MDNFIGFNEKRFIDVIEINKNSSPDEDALSYFYKDIRYNLTYADLFKAVRSLACKFCVEFDKYSPNRDDTVCYLGDGNTVLNQLALMYADLVPFFLSLKNSVDINYKLIQKCKARFLVCNTQENLDLINLCKQNLNIVHIVPFEEDPIKHIKSFKESDIYRITYTQLESCQTVQRPVFYLHSSGTTSIPKIVSIKRERILTMMKRTYTQYADKDYQKRVFALLPVYHYFGLSCVIRTLIRRGFICFPKNFYDYSNILKDIQEFNITSIIITPYIFSKLYDFREHNETEEQTKKLKIIKNLKAVEFGGAIMPYNLKSFLIKNKINVVNLYGTTETGLVARGTSFGDNDFDILYMCSDIDYEILPIDDGEGSKNFEILISKNMFENIDTEICNRPGNKYAISDLFEYRVNGKIEEGFKMIRRFDDTIVHINGEKTNPEPIESIINQNIYVEKSVLIGEGRMCNSLIIELNNSAFKQNIITVWNSIKRSISLSNRISPKQSHIFEDLVYILPYKKEKEIFTTIKGTVNRRKTTELFKKEIETLYNNFENPKEINNAKILQNNDEDITQNIISIFQKVTENRIKSLDDFFKNGLDSLTVVQFKNYLNEMHANLNIRTSDIYSNTTPLKLTNKILMLISGRSFEKEPIDIQNDVTDLYNKYTINDKDWNINTVVINKIHIESKLDILVTGANGYLGSYLVDRLSKSDRVQRVYCLVRGLDDEDAKDKIKRSFLDKNLNYNSNKILVLNYNPNLKNLGIKQQIYEELIDQINSIYHVAWRMDFLKTVEDFEDNILLTKELLNLASKTRHLCIFNFVSTIGATFPFTDKKVNLIPERELSLTIKNFEFCNGYNLSKAISEHICKKWGEKFKYPLNIYRVGQVSGDTQSGLWNIKEHIPLLIKSSQIMGMIPKDIFELGLSWIPINTTADSLCNTLFLNPLKNKILHIVNPKSCNWDMILNYIKSEYKNLKIVSSKEYIEILKRSENQNPEINPIASLTEFYEILFSSKPNWKLDTKETCELCPDTKNCKEINIDLLKKYLDYWRSIDFIK